MNELEKLKECIGLMEFDMAGGVLEKTEWNCGRVEGLKMAVAILSGEDVSEIY